MPLGSKLAYVMQLQKYHKEGVRFFSAETNVGWISRGLAHYIASQLLWDINKNPISLREEFFIHMFGKAAGEIKIEGRAAKMEDNRMILSRITQIKMYLNYVGYFKKWRETSNEKNLIALLSYAYRLQDEGIVASYPLFRRIADL